LPPETPISMSTIFPHRNIHIYSWTSDGNTDSWIDHVLIAKTRNFDMFDIHSLTRAGCNTDHYVVIETVRERLSVSKCPAQKCHTESINLKKLTLWKIKNVLC
jgi:hypothetical protein